MTADWFLARRDLRCGGCSDRIATGTPARQLRNGLIRCVACTKKLLDEDPPASLEAPASTTSAPAGDRPAQPFVTLQPTVAQFTQQLNDHKMRAGGDDDQ